MRLLSVTNSAHFLEIRFRMEIMNVVANATVE